MICPNCQVIEFPPHEGPVNFPGVCGGYALCPTERLGPIIGSPPPGVIPSDSTLLDWAEQHRAELNILPTTSFTGRINHWINPEGHDIVRIATNQHDCPTKRGAHHSSTIYVQVNLHTMLAVTRCSSHRVIDQSNTKCCDVKLSKYLVVPGGKHGTIEYRCPNWCNKVYGGKKKVCHMCKIEEDVMDMYAINKPHVWDGPIVSTEELLLSLRQDSVIRKRKKLDIAQLKKEGMRTDHYDLIDRLRQTKLGISQ